MLLNCLLLVHLLAFALAADTSDEIHRLIKKLRSKGTEKEHADAARALSSIAANSQKTEHDVIHKEGGIPALTKAFHENEGGQEAQKAIADVLTNLAKYDRERDMVKLLIKELRRAGNPGAQTQVAHALSSLAAVAITFDMIHEEGAVQALTTVLHGDNPEAQKASAVALTKLAKNGKEKDIMKKLVKEVRSPGSPEAQAAVARALSDLAVTQDQEVHNVIHAEGAVVPLVKLLNDGSLEGKKAAADALTNLAKHGHERDMVKQLMRILRSKGSPEAHAQAARALSSLAVKSENCDMIHEEGAVQALTMVLHGDSAEAQKASADAFANLAKNGKEQDVIKKMIKELRTGTPGAQAAVAHALANVAGSSQDPDAFCKNFDMIKEEGAFQALAIALHGDSPETQKAAADALANLGKCGREQIVIAHLIKELRKSSGGAQAHVAVALSNVAANNEDQDVFRKNFDLIKEEGGFLPMIKILNDGSPEAQKAVADGLTNMAKHDREKEVVSQLVKVLRKGSDGAHAQAARVLSNLAVNSENQDVLRKNHEVIHEEGAILALIKVLNEGSPEAQKEVADALTNLAKYGREQNVIKNLVKVGTEGNQQAQTHATQILSNLALKEDQDVKTKQQITQALKNLSLKKAPSAAQMAESYQHRLDISFMLAFSVSVCISISIVTLRSYSTSISHKIAQPLLAA